MRRVRRVQRIQPEVLIHRDPTARIEIIHRRRAIFVPDAVTRRVQQPRGFGILARVVEDAAEERVAVEQKRGRVGVGGSQVFDQRGRHGVESADRSAFESGGIGAVDSRARAAVHGRHVDEEVVARAGGVELVDDVSVDGEDLAFDAGEIGAVAVPDVVDPDPEREERGAGVPGHAAGVGGGAVDGEEFVLDLLAQREDGGEVGGYEGGVDGCAAEGLFLTILVSRDQE